MPTRRRTGAPVGQAPVIPYNYRHDRLSTLGTLTVSPKRHHLGRYLRLQAGNFTAVHVADFLRTLLRQLRGHVILLGDRRRIHRGRAIEAVCQAYPRLHGEEFPAYAPELNPTEPLWNDWKGHTANSLLQDLRDLRRRLHENARRVRRSQQKRRSFVLASKLPSPP